MEENLRPSWARSTLVAIIAVAVLTPEGAAAQDGHARVLVLHATRRDAQFTAIAEAELPRALDVALDGSLDYYSEVIDVARFPDAADRTAFADFLRVKYQDVRTDLVIALGDGALELIEHEGLFRDTPLVFLANDRTTRGGPNSTGLILERNFVSTLPLIQTLQPDVTQVYVVSGAAAADRAYEDLVRTQFQPYASRLTFTYLSGLATEELERRLAALPPRSAVFYVLVSEDASGNRFHPLEYVDRVIAAAAVPSYSWVDSTLGRGIVGGSLYSQRAATDRIAQLALRVLRGERPDSIPATLVDLNTNQVDWRQLQRWGIAEARVPSGTLVRFREPGPWDRYKVPLLILLAVLLTQSALIAGLLVQRERKQRVERELRRRQLDLRNSYERIRDLGGRLLNAQEAERARIARELHDDISQQLSLLAIDLAIVRSRVQAQTKELADEALFRTESIVRSVHDLSHRLHPAKLRLIGLVAALRELQTHVSHAGLPVTFTHENVPAALPHDVSLCLFRIVQEALQNALKYSGARTVSVHLIAGPAHLTLTIVDDGIGFDLDKAWGRGLGLVSMRERLEAIGGTFELRTTLGAGTRFDIRVPLFVPDDTELLLPFDLTEEISSPSATPPLA